jgi:hypothetical protein
MPRRWTRAAAMCPAVALAIAACGFALPGSGSDARDRVHEQARAALARWADAVGQANHQGVVFVGELTNQVGDWEEPVGDNNKSALMAGQIRPAASLPTEIPGPGAIHWSDGTTTTADLLTAAQALDDIIRSAGGNCSSCQPLAITAARLTTGSAQTSRGLATVPLWEFTVQGTNVKVTRVAVARRITVVAPPWDPNNAPEGISIQSARGSADARELTVSFVGAPGGGAQACGADYTAEAVESDLAVVVIVIPHPNPTPGACSLVGAERIAVVTLASPLGDRVVLEVQEGLPVQVVAP